MGNPVEPNQLNEDSALSGRFVPFVSPLCVLLETPRLLAPSKTPLAPLPTL